MKQTQAKKKLEVQRDYRKAFKERAVELGAGISSTEKDGKRLTQTKHRRKLAKMDAHTSSLLRP